MSNHPDPRMQLTLKDMDPCNPEHRWSKECKEVGPAYGETRIHFPDGTFINRWQKPYEGVSGV